MRGQRSRGADFSEVRQRAQQLLRSLDAGEVAPLYLFSGKDDFQRQAFVRRVVARLVPEERRETCLTVLDGGAVTARQVAAELESSGFRFDDEPRRVVLVRDAPFFNPGKADEAEILRSRIDAGLLDDVVLVFEVRGAVDKRLGFTKTVTAMATWLEFDALESEDDVLDFANARLRRGGKRIERQAAAELVQRVGTSAMALTNELDKLTFYVGQREEIALADVREMVAPTAELSVFDLVDAVVEQRPQAALEQLEALLNQRAEPFMILAMLIRQFRLLLQARYLLDTELVDSRLLQQRPYDFNQSISGRQGGASRLETWKERTAGILPADGKASLLGQHYFPLWKTLNVARRLSSPAVEAALERLLQTDLALKSSHLPERQELELLVVDLCTRIEAGATVDLATIMDL